MVFFDIFEAFDRVWNHAGFNLKTECYGLCGIYFVDKKLSVWEKTKIQTFLLENHIGL